MNLNDVTPNLPKGILGISISVYCFIFMHTSFILDSGFAAVAGLATGQARRLFDFLQEDFVGGTGGASAQPATANRHFDLL